MDPRELLAAFDKFDKDCEESQYTDTGVAWWFLNALADALRDRLDDRCPHCGSPTCDPDGACL